MKKFIKGMCLTGVALLMFGIIFGIIGFTMGGTLKSIVYNAHSGEFVFQNSFPFFMGKGFNGNGWSFFGHEVSSGNEWNTKSAYNQQSAVITDKITDLNFTLGACDANVREGDEFSYKIEGEDISRFRINTDDGIFSIVYESRSNKFPDDLNIDITVPKNAKFDSVNFELGAGRMSIDGIETRSANFIVGAGKMNISNCVSDTETNIDVGAAEFTFSGDLKGETDINLGMGTAEMTLDDITDFGYDIEVGLGSVKVPGRSLVGAGEILVNEGAKRFYTIDCGMGSVNIKSNS